MFHFVNIHYGEHQNIGKQFLLYKTGNLQLRRSVKKIWEPIDDNPFEMLEKHLSMLTSLLAVLNFFGLKFFFKD